MVNMVSSKQDDKSLEEGKEAKRFKPVALETNKIAEKPLPSRQQQQIERAIKYLA